MGKWCQSNRIQAVGGWRPPGSWPTWISHAGFSEFQFYYLLYETLDQMVTKDFLIFKMGERLGHPYSDLFTVHIVGIWNVPQFHGPQLVSQIDLAANLTQPRVNWEGNFIGRTAQIRVACGYVENRRPQHPVDGTSPVLVIFGYLRKHESVSKSGSTIPP